MLNIQGTEAQIERVDDLPVIFGILQQMSIQTILDKVIVPHGNWDGLSPGWVITIWLMHILSEHQHTMEPVQAWAGRHLHVLCRLTGQEVRELDFTDDRLASCLLYLRRRETWTAIEARLGATLMRVYDLNQCKVVRLDATVGSVGHDPAEHTLFQVGKAKNGQYETQFKMMLASLDPLGLPVATDVVSGDRADDPLYVPCYLRMKDTLKQSELLIVGDCKMSALATRATIVAGNDYYLSPLDLAKDEPNLLEHLLEPWQGREVELRRIFLPQDLPADGREPDPNLAIAYGFETSRTRTTVVNGKTVDWTERLLVVCSFNYRKTIQDGLYRRIDKAEAALQALTPARHRGKKQITDEASLLAAIKQIESRYHVEGLLQISYECEVQEKHIQRYKDKPERVERQVRYQLTVSRNQQAIAALENKAGWRIYVTNAPTQTLNLSQAVLAYRDQYLVENVFRRLQGRILSITPVYVQRDDHAQGLFHLLTIGARVLSLGDYLAKASLAKEKPQQPSSSLTGIYRGNPKRGTTHPTTERMLKAFEGIDLLVMSSQAQPVYYLTQLSPVQERILVLLGLPLSLYTDLQSS